MICGAETLTFTKETVARSRTKRNRKSCSKHQTTGPHGECRNPMKNEGARHYRTTHNSQMKMGRTRCKIQNLHMVYKNNKLETSGR